MTNDNRMFEMPWGDWSDKDVLERFSQIELFAQVSRAASVGAEHAIRGVIETALKKAEASLQASIEDEPQALALNDEQLAAWREDANTRLAVIRRQVLRCQQPFVAGSVDGQLIDTLDELLTRRLSFAIDEATRVAIQELWTLAQLEKAPFPLREEVESQKQPPSSPVSDAWLSLHEVADSWSAELQSASDQVASAALALTRAVLRNAETALASNSDHAGDSARLAQVRQELLFGDGVGVPELNTLSEEQADQLELTLKLASWANAAIAQTADRLTRELIQREGMFAGEVEEQGSAGEQQPRPA